MADLLKSLVAPNERTIQLNTGLFLNNEFVTGNGEKLATINPADGTEITSVETASAEDVDAAVKIARTAFKSPEWRNIAPASRGALLYKLAELVDEEREILATIEAWDNGKPYLAALEEDIAGVSAAFRYYAGWADKIHGSTTDKAGFAQINLGYTMKEPVGVCALIVPWNYPLGQTALKIGPAIACGNTVVIKASEMTPLSILYLASLVVKAGFPPGIINIINGLGRVTGQALVSHPGINKISFTGSTATGKQILRSAAANMTSVTLETGGKSPMIVFADSDLEQAAKWAQMGITSNKGEVCTANSRLLVERSVLEEFLRFFQEAIEQGVNVGDPFDSETTFGPQVSKDQYKRILGFIERAKTEGAKLIMGGGPFQSDQVNKEGFYIRPTVFSEVKSDMELFKEEVFGPVAAVTTFDTEEEAVRLANCSNYGLGAAVFSSSIERVHRVAQELETGMVWINNSQDGDVRMPFGGVKQSGIGREMGEAALAAYMQEKSVHVNLGFRLP